MSAVSRRAPLVTLCAVFVVGTFGCDKVQHWEQTVAVQVTSKESGNAIHDAIVRMKMALHVDEELPEYERQLEIWKQEPFFSHATAYNGKVDMKIFGGGIHAGREPPDMTDMLANTKFLVQVIDSDLNTEQFEIYLKEGVTNGKNFSIKILSITQPVFVPKSEITM